MAAGPASMDRADPRHQTARAAGGERCRDTGRCPPRRWPTSTPRRHGSAYTATATTTCTSAWSGDDSGLPQPDARPRWAAPESLAHRRPGPGRRARPLPVPLSCASALIRRMQRRGVRANRKCPKESDPTSATCGVSRLVAARKCRQSRTHRDEARASAGGSSARATQSDQVAPPGQGDSASDERHCVSDHDDPTDPPGRGVRKCRPGGGHDL
jgi:hypothetical protein